MKVEFVFDMYVFGIEGAIFSVSFWSLILGLMPGIGSCPFTLHTVFPFLFRVFLGWAMSYFYAKQSKQNALNKYQAWQMLYPDLFPEREHFVVRLVKKTPLIRYFL